MSTDNGSSKVVLCVAPHPDDESLGCGGTLLRHAQESDEIHWLIFTSMISTQGFAEERISKRSDEINSVANAYGFKSVQSLGFPTTNLDTLPKSTLVSAASKAIQAIKPSILYLPYRYDAHSDHACVFDAVAACTKAFRYPYIKRVLAYETLSETEFGLRPGNAGFSPNYFVDIQGHLDQKLQILDLYQGEMGAFPFPRSHECVTALSQLRGSQAGVAAAEAFMLLKEIR